MTNNPTQDEPDEMLAKQIAKRTMKDLRVDRDTGMLYVAAVEAAKRTISHLSPRITQQAEEVARLRQALKAIANNPNYPASILHGIAYRALNEQPVAEWQKGQN